MPETMIRQRTAQLIAVARRPSATMAITVVLLNVIRIASTLVLTRLLDVAVFGVAGILTAVTVVIGMISDLGFNVYVIRHADGENPRFLDEVWTLRLIRSVVLTAGMAALAPLIAAYVGEPQLGPVLAVFSLTFLIEGLTSLAVATASRSGHVLKLGMFDIFGAIGQTATTILFAWWMRDYWGIVYGSLTGGAIKILLSYTMFARSCRGLRFNGDRAADLWRFARYITGSSIITLILTQGDKIALSRLLSLDQFGLYAIAASLALAAAGFTGPYANRVLYPTYSRAMRDEPGNIAHVYRLSGRWIRLLYAFAAGCLTTAAPLVIEILYDPRYRGAALYLQLLAIGTVPLMNTQAGNAVLIATGRMWTTLNANLIRLAWLAGGGYAGYRLYGVPGLVGAVGTVELIAQLYYWLELRRARLLSLRTEGLQIATTIGGLIIGAAASYAALSLFGMAG